MIRYGILSTASIVPRFVHALRETGSGEAVAIASRNEKKAKEKANDLGIEKAYASYEELLDDASLDAVYIAMINSEHYKYALLALEKGKHVVCEKPFTLTYKEAVHLFDVAKEKQLFIVEAQKVVFLPAMQEVKDVLASKVLGKVQFVDLTSSCEPSYNPWVHDVKSGGGALYGNASYGVHLMRYLFDSPIEAYSGLCTRGNSSADEQCAINLRLKDDVLVTSKISTNVLAINRALIFAEHGHIEIFDYWKAREATIYFKDGTKQVISHPCKYELVYELQHFNDCILNNVLESPIMSKEMTCESIKVLEALQKMI